MAWPGVPPAREVEEALYARVPGAVIPFSEAARRGALQLTWHRPRADGRRSSHLAGRSGRPRLSRSLGGAAGQKDCAALAETAALIVQRFLTELDDPVPLPPSNSASAGHLCGESAGARAALGSLARPAAGGWAPRSWARSRSARGSGGCSGSDGRLLLVAGGRRDRRRGDLPAAGHGIHEGARAPASFPSSSDCGCARWTGRSSSRSGRAADWISPGSRRAPRTGGNTDVTCFPGPSCSAATALRVPLRGRTFFRLSGGIGGSVSDLSVLVPSANQAWMTLQSSRFQRGVSTLG